MDYIWQTMAVISGVGFLMDSSDKLQESSQRPWPQAMEGKNSTSELTNAFNAPTRGCQNATKFLEAELQLRSTNCCNRFLSFYESQVWAGIFPDVGTEPNKLPWNPLQHILTYFKCVNSQHQKLIQLKSPRLKGTSAQVRSGSS